MESRIIMDKRCVIVSKEKKKKKIEKKRNDEPLLARDQCDHQWRGMTNRREKAISSQGRVSKGAFAFAISHSSCHYPSETRELVRRLHIETHVH